MENANASHADIIIWQYLQPPPPPPPPAHLFLLVHVFSASFPEAPSAHSRGLVWHTGHRARRVVLASGPQITADLRGFAKGHADAGGAEEGVGGTVVFAEVEVHVGACKVGILKGCLTAILLVARRGTKIVHRNHD